MGSTGSTHVKPSTRKQLRMGLVLLKMCGIPSHLPTCPSTLPYISPTQIHQGLHPSLHHHPSPGPARQTVNIYMSNSGTDTFRNLRVSYFSLNQLPLLEKINLA